MGTKLDTEKDTIYMTDKSRSETETLQVGDIAPDFTLKSGKEEWRLKDFRNKKNVVLAFVPFAFSSVCSAQLPSYEAELDRFKDFDTEVVSISMDSNYALDAWRKQMNITFPLLSDFYPQGKVVDMFGVRHQAGMANRALIVIDKEGVIRYIEVLNNPGDLPNNEDLFEALRKL
jgi:mycoredoxin-dependent peroxiredoxin